MKKILIVEDEAAYLKILHAQLTDQGYQVIDAIDGKEGLEKAKNEKPNLILLDVRMPIMDGMTMLGLLRKETLGEKMKVILLTNLEPDEKMTADIINHRIESYYIKSDIQFNELIKKIKELLED
jgi:DNA-binding response OmpR family regulator